MGVAKVFVGQKYSRLLIVARDEDVIRKNGKVIRTWKCVCDCGKEVVVHGAHLRSGHTKSCGCILEENRPLNNLSHGCSSTAGYRKYHAMLDRCYKSDRASYEHYGGRGITVCDRWLEPYPRGLLNFLEDMGECPDGMSLDRIDVNGNYCKENCRWATNSEQSFNRRTLKANTSGKTGIRLHKHSGLWHARISVNYKEISLGYYADFNLAVKAREAAELKYYGESKPEAREEEVKDGQ